MGNMPIQIEINGELHPISKEELFTLAAQGKIRPDTIIVVNGQHVSVSKMKGIVFPTATALPEQPIADAESGVGFDDQDMSS